MTPFVGMRSCRWGSESLPEPLPLFFVCPLISVLLISFKPYLNTSAVDMPLPGITLQVTPSALKTLRVSHISDSRYHDNSFFSLEYG
jgi:hypothetical protein